MLLVFFYNFGWKDYGEASLTSLLDMVKVMAFSVSEGKVAIHCHAGQFENNLININFVVQPAGFEFEKSKKWLDLLEY